MYIYLHEVDEELGLFGESLFEWFGVAHWRKLHVSEQRILGEDLQMLRVQISCRNKTTTSYIHTYIHTNSYSAKNRENESEALAKED